MTDPPVVELVRMQDDMDCCICTLVMYLQIPYPKVIAACPRGYKSGLTSRQMKNVARRLRRPLISKPAPDDDDVGILNLERKDGSDGHSVLYVRGAVYNPAEGLLWPDYDTFLKDRGWVVECLLVNKPPKYLT